ncbi:MAG: sugar phosphate nucleotidyltransferase [Syntrophales bacterium]|nr:sugar phosphate nucleotidyltransferase [Syntrophales bacterium]MDY0044378.1 mannose-1-phosphate guanylyltransferase [Syntrophales bacterium]
MAGGRGTRFWPLSREAKPKQLISFTGQKTLLQETVDRIEPLVPLRKILIITGAAHAEEVIGQFPDLPKENVIIEPMGRNTAPCIGLAACHLKKKDPDAIMIVLPADHTITDHASFTDTLKTASETAQQGNYLVTIGIRPSAPETGYGYIEAGLPLAPGNRGTILKVASFREKPDFETARSFLERGTFYWNSGMFIWKVSSILEALERELPELYHELQAIEPSLGTLGEEKAVKKAYERICPVSIDYGVMEKAGNVILIPGDFGWNDLGSWDALMDFSPKDANGNVFRGTIINIDSTGSLIFAKEKPVAAVGVSNLIVVETEDAILVMRKGRSQDVKKAVDVLEKNNLKELL